MKSPTWMYKANSDGTVVAGLFDASHALPDGWFDSPGKAEKPKRGRPAKDSE